MSTPDDLQLGTGGSSVAARIKAKAKAKREPLILKVPRWEGLIMLECKEVRDRDRKAAQKKGKSALVASADLLIAGCEQVLLADPDSGDVVPAGQDTPDGGPVGIDSRLAEMFDLPDEGPRRILMALYGNEVAIQRHASRLLLWTTGDDLDDADEDEVDDLAGEEDAAI